MSPSSVRSANGKPNGSAQLNINNSLRGKAPLRPMREDAEDEDSDSQGIITGERALSPEQGRAKSPLFSARTVRYRLLHKSPRVRSR